MYNKTRQNFRVVKTSLDLKRPLPSTSRNLSFLITRARNILRDALLRNLNFSVQIKQFVLGILIWINSTSISSMQVINMRFGSSMQVPWIVNCCLTLLLVLWPWTKIFQIPSTKFFSRRLEDNNKCRGFRNQQRQEWELSFIFKSSAHFKTIMSLLQFRNPGSLKHLRFSRCHFQKIPSLFLANNASLVWWAPPSYCREQLLPVTLPTVWRLSEYVWRSAFF